MYPARPRRSLPRAQAAPSRSVPVSEAQQLMLPLMLAFLFAVILAWPSHVRAQGGAGVSVTASSGGTHTVRPGETLWSLAARYYGNGHRWRDLASENGLAEGGEHVIEVGQVLRVPIETPSLAIARAAMAEAPPASTPSAAVTPAVSESVVSEPEVAPVAVSDAPSVAVVSAAAEPASAPVERSEAAETAVRAPRIGIVRPNGFAEARGHDNVTIFLGPAPIDADTMTGTIWLSGEESFVAPAGRRVGEFQAAPVALGAERWKTIGRVTARAEAAGARATSQIQRMQPRDLVEVALPEGVEAVAGTRVVTVSQGADLGDGVRLAIPTGVLTLEAPRNGVAVARVTRLYGVIEQGQAVLPYVEPPAAAATMNVTPVETTVRWITATPLLPSIQSYLVLDTPEGVEFERGDRFELLSASSGGSVVAEARVVRVTPDGVTAIITSQSQPAIRSGMPARRIGRAP